MRPDAIIIGAGVIGLVTALRLRAQGLAVEIWTRDLPEQTTSAVAGAIWYPFLAEPRDRVSAWSSFTYQRLGELAADPDAGVHMQPVVEVFDHDEPDLWWGDDVPGIVRLAGDELPDGYRAAVRVEVPVCDVPVHMRWLMRQLQQQSIAVVSRDVRSFDEAFAVANIVVNCTGLGARELCNDNELQAVRGQVLQVEATAMPHAWIDDTREGPCYVIPRADGLVVGGTAQMADERTAVDASDTEAIMERACRTFPQLLDAKVLATRVGLRPYRSTVRLEEPTRDDGRRLIHNYGHGGSGYTLAWGCAEDVATLLR